MWSWRRRSSWPQWRVSAENQRYTWREVAGCSIRVVGHTSQLYRCLGEHQTLPGQVIHHPGSLSCYCQFLPDSLPPWEMFPGHCYGNWVREMIDRCKWMLSIHFFFWYQWKFVSISEGVSTGAPATFAVAPATFPTNLVRCYLVCEVKVKVSDG